ncbi:MAG: preprotein translocase subunit SecY, partial [Erysipelotrichales bacterium]|nr:preprotein translocase subunit SecY [Erysipelotrichales bacterium]
MLRNLGLMFKNKEIRNRILFTLAILFVYRLGAAIPVPGINKEALLAGVESNNIINLMNLLGGGALDQFSVLALGVGPYITASIIIELLAMDVIPALADLKENGQEGRKKMDRITRYLGLVLAFLQSYTMTYAFNARYGILENPSVSTYLFISMVLTAGTSFLIWLGDQISDKGIGNGISMIIFAGIVANLPFQFRQAYRTLVDTSAGTSSTFSGVVQFAMLIALYIVLIVMIIFMNEAVRKIPIQYTSNTRAIGGQNINYLPLKINSASVIPVIFASAVMVAPVTIMSFFKSTPVTETITNILDFTKPLGLVIYVILVILFTFFYTNLQVDPKELANNLNKQGTYILGIRPGSETVSYIHKVLNRITVLGA